MPFSRTKGSISTRFGTPHPRVKGNQLKKNQGLSFSQTGNTDIFLFSFVMYCNHRLLKSADCQKLFLKRCGPHPLFLFFFIPSIISPIKENNDKFFMQADKKSDRFKSFYCTFYYTRKFFICETVTSSPKPVFDWMKQFYSFARYYRVVKILTNQ